MKNLSISILNVKNLSTFMQNVINAEKKLKDNKVSDRFNITIHFDVMDNKFVPNTGVDIQKIIEIKKFGYHIDTHLMVEKPIEEGYIDKAIDYGSEDITIHYEIDEFEKTLEYLIEKKHENPNIKIGVSVKPKTDIKVLDKYMSKIDKVLIMSVEPGFGGQAYIDDVTSKISYVKEKYKDIFVQVDGGVDGNTLQKPIGAQVDSVVVGSYLTRNEEELYDRICILSIVLDINTIPKEANLDFERRTIQAVDGGYAQGDILLGIRVPKLRKVSKFWYNKISMKVIEFFMSSKIHDYRRFAVFCLTYKVEKDNYLQIKDFIDNNLQYINNWDLVDSLAPICIGKQILDENNSKIYDSLQKYTKSKNVWTKRIGIVSLLYIAKNNRKEVVFRVLDDVFYEDYHLYQKATGWVLRELYKVNPKDTLMYLIEKNNKKKIPSILKSYATEKMTIQEKEMLR